MSEKLVKVFVTKYALTEGIFQKELSESDGYYSSPSGSYRWLFLSRKDVAFTQEEAITKADAMRKKKIESIKKQIGKLEGMKFAIKGYQE